MDEVKGIRAELDLRLTYYPIGDTALQTHLCDESQDLFSDPILSESPKFTLMAMIRHRRAAASTVPTRLLYSARSQDEVIYRGELDGVMHSDGMLEVIYTFTRRQPPGWTGYHRRIDEDLLREVAWPVEAHARAYICGPTQFVETAATSLVGWGIPQPT